MATRFLLRRLPRRIHLPNSPKTSAVSSFLVHRFTPADESLSRSRWSPNEDVWCSSGRRFNSVAEKSGEGDEEEWSVKESQILKDVERIARMAKEILHSGRYDCGEMLSPEDEKEVVEKLLAYHPQHENKIGCGMDYIMVDWHPVYPKSKCLFVVRKDGTGEDFSYRKCLIAYVKHKYPSDAERFLPHFFEKLGSAPTQFKQQSKGSS